MAQISKGTTFSNGDQVTGALLNQLVDSSTLLVGAIADQPSITANTLQATDSTIVNDAGVLKEATIGDFLNSNLPITTSSITGGTGVDLVLTPAAGQKVDIAGNIEVDDIAVTDDATISGDLLVTGGSTLTGNVVADNGFTSNGVANFTGTLQVNGTVGYVLTDVIEESIASSSPTTGATTWTDLFTSSSHTKPTGEVWILELDATWYYSVTGQTAARFIRTSDSTVLDLKLSVESAPTAYFHYENTGFKYYFNSASSFTSTFKVQGFGAGLIMYFAPTGNWFYNSNVQLIQPKFRIYKYKTA